MGRKKGCIPWNKGKTGIYSEETLESNREKHLGKIPWNKGISWPEEIKEKIRVKRLGTYSSDETKQKLRDNHIGMLGKHHTEETKQKMRENKLNIPIEDQPFFGKRHTEESKQKIKDNHADFSGENNPNYGKHHTEETKQKIREATSNENSVHWKGGVSFLPYCPKFNEIKKEEIREKYNRKCYFCSKDEKDNVTKTNKLHKLSIHHIDEDKEQGCNGKQWKLIPVCMKCHMKIHKNKIEVN